MKICFVMTEGIGNMVMATPALRAIKVANPDCHLAVFGKYPALSVVKGHEVVDEVITELSDNHFFDMLLLSIWDNDFHAKYPRETLPKWFKDAIKAQPNDPDTHESEYHLALARDLGYKGELPDPFIATTAPYINIINYTGYATGEVDGKPALNKYAILADTSLDTPEWDRKRWPYFSDLARKLVDEGVNVLLVGNEGDKKRFDASAYPTDNPRFQSRFNLTIPQLTCLIQNCKYFVGNDSGPAHIAGALGVETYVIFGATRITKNAPLCKDAHSENVHIVHKPMGCSPCQYTGWWDACQVNECMTQITAQKIYDHISNTNAGKATFPVSSLLDPSPIKIVAVMRIKDAMPTIRECLDSVSAVVDEICIVDNGSTDGTLDVYKEYENIVSWEDTDSLVQRLHLMEGIGEITLKDRIICTEGLNEPRDRTIMDAMFRERNADWVLFIDADEVLEGAITRLRIEEWISSNEYNAIWFRHCHFWGDKQHYRIDQRWKPRHRRGLFKVTAEASMIPNQRTNPAVVYNLKGNVLQTDLVVKHYGHIDQDRNKARQELWRSIDNESHDDWTGMNYDHMTDETYLELAEWSDNPGERVYGKESALLICLHGGGDCLMLTPTLEAITQANSNVELSIMGLEQIDERDFKTHEIFEGNPNVKYYYPSSLDHHPTWWHKETFDEKDSPVIQEDINRIQQLTSFDQIVLVSLQENRHLHRIDRHAKQFGVELKSRQMHIYPDTADKRYASQFLSHLHIVHGDKIVSVHRFCGHPPKSWDFHETEKLCQSLVERGYKVILWDQDEREPDHDPHQILMDGVTNMRDYFDELSVRRSAAIMEFCDLHIGADSMPMHLACAVGIPTIGIFSKTRPHETAPMIKDSAILVAAQIAMSIPEQFMKEHENRIYVAQDDEVKSTDVLDLVDSWFKSGNFGQIRKPSVPTFPLNCIYDLREARFYRHHIKALDEFAKKCPELVHNPLKWFDHVRLLDLIEGKGFLKVLDIGGGQSIWTLFLAVIGHRVDSVDPDSEGNKKRAEMAIRLRVDERVYFYNGTIFDGFQAGMGQIGHIFDGIDMGLGQGAPLSAGGGEVYDVVSCVSTIEHIKHDTETLIEAAKYLKVGGLMHVTCDFYEKYIEYPNANREIVTDRDSGHCDSRIYDVEALYTRIIHPLERVGLSLIGDTDFENVDFSRRESRPVRGLYGFARMFFEKTGEIPSMEVDIDGGKMLIPERDKQGYLHKNTVDGIEGDLTYGGDDEQSLQIHLLECLTDDDVFYDIGANAGFYSMIAGKRCKSVVAFEPNNRMYPFLDYNLKGIHSIIKMVACSDKHGLNYLHGESTVMDSKSPQVIRMARLDDMPITRPDVVKIDVEGMECEVLEDGKEKLSHARVIFVELHPNKTDRNPRPILEDMGFDVENISPTHLMATYKPLIPKYEG